MKAIFLPPYIPFVRRVGNSTSLFVGKPTLPLKLVMTIATVATLASLGIAIYAGWQFGGSLIERILRVVLIGVAVLFAHWLPTVWSALCGVARGAASALWIIAIAVVLYGQTAFFMLSQHHAGDLRAAAVATPIELITTNVSVRRSRTEIARDIAKVSAELARLQAARCVGECPKLWARRARLAAELAALEVEAEEAMRRQASEDRRLTQADRLDQQRQRLRADPVALPVAAWLGATTHFLELILGLAHAVVLEGAAIVGWLLVSHALSRDASRHGSVSDREFEEPNRTPAVDSDSSRAVLSEDEEALGKIHVAVVAGEIKPTQKAIRQFLQCAQSKAGELNRRYLERFGPVTE